MHHEIFKLGHKLADMMSLQMTPTNKQSDDSSNRTPNPVHLQLYCTPIWVKRVTLHQLIHRNLQSEIKQKITALRFFTAFTFGVTRRRSKCGRGNCAPIYFKLAPISDSKIGNKISLFWSNNSNAFSIGMQMNGFGFYCWHRKGNRKPAQSKVC